MGQATADLPDPLEERPEPGGNNDELLSQLAGEEIDRLLADDAGAAKSAAAGGESPSSPSPPAEPTQDASQGLGTFLNEVDEGKRPVQATRDAAAVEDAVSQEQATQTPEQDAAERSALEVGRLNAAIEADLGEKPAPLLLRPLVWISAPLDMLPDGVRAGIGKVALVTFFNAVAILLYLLIFRR